MATTHWFSTGWLPNDIPKPEINCIFWTDNTLNAELNVGDVAQLVN